MQYTRQVMDLDTGAVTWVELGDHRPFSEVAKSLSIGPRKFREVLAHMGMVSREWDARAQQRRHRLVPAAVESGLGVRHDNIGCRYDPDRVPFDVLSPKGIEYVRDHLQPTLAAMTKSSAQVSAAIAELTALDDKRLSPLPLSQKVCWLEARYPNIRAARVAAACGVSERVVHKYRRRLAQQRGYWRDWSTALRPPKPLSAAAEVALMFDLDAISTGCSVVE